MTLLAAAGYQTLLVSEHQILVPRPSSLLQLGESVSYALPHGFLPVRFVVSKSDEAGWSCEVGGISGVDLDLESIFEFRRRNVENHNLFTTALLIPTGVGAEVGGHAGDGGPVAKLVGQVTDRLVLHPNVVNGSDINEMPTNAYYVEGSVICRLLMGTVGVQPVRNNRILAVIDDHEVDVFKNAAVNSINGARATYGVNCQEILFLNPPVKLRARFSASGRAAGRIEHIAGLIEAIESRNGSFDAVAVSSVIDVPGEFHQGYFDAAGEMVNPWGGVEALLTHSLSMILGVPTAHSPMFESCEIAECDPGIVDPRMAAEAVSVTFLNCTLKGLHQSPKLVFDHNELKDSSVLSVEDVSCLVIPDGCLGLPVLAALEQGIKVIAVRENSNVVCNDLNDLPWDHGQFFRVENYWEAAGVIAALRSGIDPKSVRRPFGYARVSTFNALSDERSEPDERSIVDENKAR